MQLAKDAGITWLLPYSMKTSCSTHVLMKASDVHLA